MNKIIRSNFLIQKLGKLVKPVKILRAYSKDEKDKPPSSGSTESQVVVHEKPINSKKESKREESYFHKEEVERLKELKKKLKHDKKKGE